MPLQKNQVLTLTIERLSNDGSGVTHSPDGEAVFVPGTAPGDEADIPATISAMMASGSS